MLGAFSLLVFLTDFVDVGLKGVIRDAFDGWVFYVRPAAGYLLQLLNSLLPSGWRFELQPIEKDYFAVGLVLSLSFLRSLGLTRSTRSLIANLALFAGTMLVWPLALVGGVAALLYTALVGDADYQRIGRDVALIYSPLIYLGLLFAANAWLL